MNPALANLNLDSIVDRIANGEYQSHIARQLGIPPQTLHGHVSKHPGYREALRLRNMVNLDDAQDGITTNPDLARAREHWKAATWRAERECPEEWGNRTQLQVSGSISLDLVLGEVIEQEPQPVGQISSDSGDQT